MMSSMVWVHPILLPTSLHTVSSVASYSCVAEHYSCAADAM
jgi:hypothetical protein